MEDFEYINKELGTSYNLNHNINWKSISYDYHLSEEFIEKFQDKLDWFYISVYQKLSEPFIEKYHDKVDWFNISSCQLLSESFIEKYANKLNWDYLSQNQLLSESFIEKYQDKVNWYHVSMFQKLSEPFIEKFQNKVVWYNISTYQKLSESFIENFKHKVFWDKISMHQTLSDEFIEKHQLSVNKNDLWQYKPENFKKQKLIETKKYECYDDYFIAYKAIRSDRYSLFNFQYQYLTGEAYESTCDCTAEENSFGLNVGTYEHAKKYLEGKIGLIVKCKIYYKDIGRIVHDGDKVRCFKITVLE